MRSERGVTLIELLIAITLVAALSVGMLLAVRVGLVTLEKTDHRMEANRRVVAANRILYRELSGAMPVVGACGPVFRGDSQRLRLVSSYSLKEGARGAPQVLELAIVAGDRGWRLIVNETPYYGPATTSQFCGDAGAAPTLATAQSFVLADHLASCVFGYKDTVHDSVLTGAWLEAWVKPDFPSAVRVQMTPLATSLADLPLLNVTVPLNINREVLAPYADSWQ